MHGIVHRNLSLDSVRIVRQPGARQPQCVLGGFELACHVDRQPLLANVGPHGAIAPECLSDNTPVTTGLAYYTFSADVYSFGIMLRDLHEIQDQLRIRFIDGLGSTASMQSLLDPRVIGEFAALLCVCVCTAL